MPNVIVYTSTGCNACAQIKELLHSRGVQFEEKNVTDHPEYLDELTDQNLWVVPTTFVNGEAVPGLRLNKLRKILDSFDIPAAPATPDTASEVEPKEAPEVYDVVVVGGGPGGATAAMYAARAELATLIVDKALTSGALGMTGRVENFPGMPNASGPEIVQTIRDQAVSFGAHLRQEQVIGVDDLAAEVKLVKLGSGDVVKARTLILASGSMSRKNPIEGEDQFVGKGVSYCATCDGAFYRGRHVAVVGNNDEALSDALLLTRYAESVQLLSPRRNLAAAEDLVAQVQSSEKIAIQAGYSLRAIKGNGRANSIVVRNGSAEEEMPVDGVFIYLQGNRPSTEYVGDALKKTPDGYVEVDPTTYETSVPGVYAIGDLLPGDIRQAVVAAAQGCVAAVQIEKALRGRKRVRADWK